MLELAGALDARRDVDEDLLEIDNALASARAALLGEWVAGSSSPATLGLVRSRWLLLDRAERHRRVAGFDRAGDGRARARRAPRGWIEGLRLLLDRAVDGDEGLLEIRSDPDAMHGAP